MKAPPHANHPSPPFWQDAGSLWQRITTQSNPAMRRLQTSVTLALVVVIGLADFLLGTDYSMQVFYFIPIATAVVARGWKFGVVIALVSVSSWIGGDLINGVRYTSPVVPFWNATIALLTYLVLVGLLSGLLALQRELEERVRLRTAALSEEIAERERLERVILDIRERERNSIGHDLHDGLGQHLTGTALTGQLLAEKLRERTAPEEPDARRLVALVKSAIEQTRDIARGLLVQEIDAEGLPGALREFCSAAGRQFGISCLLRLNGPVTLPRNDLATHLYRIAQEAVHNAGKHSGASRIEVELLARDGDLTLTVRDNGAGLPNAATRGHGLGLRIMAHRAALIGASFSVESPADGGTLVRCRVSLPSHE